MNKQIKQKEIDIKNNVDFVSSAADIDSDNYSVHLKKLDVERTVRIYKSLLTLSENAVKAVSLGKSNEFSIYIDKMRPLMSYIADNNVKLSSFVEAGELP